MYQHDFERPFSGSVTLFRINWLDGSCHSGCDVASQGRFLRGEMLREGGPSGMQGSPLA